MAKKKDWVGKRFGRLVVAEETEKNNHGQRTFICVCDCGNVTHPITISNLKKTKSCGCYKREYVEKRLHQTSIATTHNQSNSRLYLVWQGMKQRCTNPKHEGYKNYGGRGISVCGEWANNYEAFRNWALANGYNADAERGECTIDRIDVNGNYCPKNCRWIDMVTQQNNRRNNVKREVR